MSENATETYMCFQSIHFKNFFKYRKEFLIPAIKLKLITINSGGMWEHLEACRFCQLELHLSHVEGQ